MSNDYTQYSSLKRITAMALDEMSMTYDEIDKAWIFSFRALQLMNQQFAAEPKTIRIKKNGNQTVTLPTDYISWSKIGVLNSNGEVSTLKINNALTTYNSNSPNRISSLTADIASNLPALYSAPYYYNFYYNGTYQALFGVGGGLIQYGECRVDELNGVIILNPEFRYDSIILEYLSSPQDDDDYQIPTFLQEAVIAFIKWKYNRGTRQEFYGAAEEGRRALPKKKVILQEIAQVVRETTGMYLKT